MSSPLLTQAQAIAESLLAELPRRRDHVRGVALRAGEVVEALDEEAATHVVAAAWLHDIGYSPYLVNTGFHPVDGARHLRAEKFPELIVSLVAHHTGAAVEAQERGLANLLREFDLPPAQLLDFVTCADMQTGPDGGRVEAQDRIDEILRRYSIESPVHRAVSRSSPELLAAVDRVAIAVQESRRAPQRESNPREGVPGGSRD